VPASASHLPWIPALATSKNTWESLQSVFLYVFSPSKYNSKLYFFKNLLVWALGTLSTLIVQQDTWWNIIL
jgi:hypothetical protein